MNLKELRKKFKKTVIGIDIDDRSIEVVELVKENNNTKILNLGRIELDSQIVRRGRIKDKKKLFRSMKKVLERAIPGPILKENQSILGKLFSSKVYFGLPESQIYTYVLDVATKDLGGKKSNKTKELVLKEVNRTIPIDKKDVIYTHKILKKDKEKTKILLIASSRTVMEEWQMFFKLFNIKLEYFDSEVLASFRGLLIKDDKYPVCIVDIGAVVTTISIFDNSGLYYSHSIEVAGCILTREIAKNLQINIRQAEEEKIRYGLDVSRKIFPILIKSLEPIVKEINLSLNFFKREAKQDIKNIILIGGSSKLKGLVDYLSTNIPEKEISIGNSILVKEKSPLEYIESVGLAFSGFNNQHSKNTTFLYLKINKENIGDMQKEMKQVLKSKTQDRIARSSIFFKKLYTIDRVKFQRNLIYIIIIISLVLLGLAFLYRNTQRDIREENIRAKIDQLAQIQVLGIKVLIATEEQDDMSQMVDGRIIENEVNIVQAYDDAIEESRKEASLSLEEGEVLWQEPIDKGDEDNIIFPLKIKWIAYNNKRADELLVSKIDQYNIDNADYIVNDIKKNNLTKTSNSNIFNLEARVVISSHKTIEVIEKEQVSESDLESKDDLGSKDENQKSKKPKEYKEEGFSLKEVVDEDDNEVVEEKDQIQELIIDEKQNQIINIDEEEPSEDGNLPKVKIKDTETGWLNVRTGPAVNFDILIKVYPGESYPLLEKRDKWYLLKIDQNRSGWAHSFYLSL